MFTGQINQADIVQIVSSEFDLGRPVRWFEIGVRGCGIFDVTTTTARVVIKPVKSLDWALLYSEVEKHLNSRGVRQARLLCSSDKRLISSSGHCVWVPIGWTNHE